MTSKRSKPRDFSSIFEPIATFTVTAQGLKVGDDFSNARAWDVLNDVGRRIPCAAEERETIGEYAMRLRERLAALDRRQYLDGAAVFALQLEVNAVLSFLMQPPRRKGKRT